jgi:PAS domain S-box-containing protein
MEMRIPRPPESSRSASAYLGLIAQILGLAAVYFLSAKLGLAFAFSAEQISVIWPPTGIALSVLLLFGYRLWPGIALGAFLANITTSGPVWTALAISGGNTLEALAGAWLLRRFVKFDPSLSRVKDILGLILFAAMGSTAIGATIGVTSLSMTGSYSWSEYYSHWWLWWFGDGMGALVVGSFVLSWTAQIRTSQYLREWPDLALLALLIVLISVLIFSPNSFWAEIFPPSIVVFPLVIWAALRLGPSGASLAILAILTVAIVAALKRIEPFGDDVEESLIGLQVYMSIVALTGLALASANRERQLNKAALRAREEDMSYILEATQVGTWDWDIRTGNLQWSKNMEEVHRAPPKSFGGKFEDFLNDIHPDDRDRVQESVRQALQQGTVYHVDYRRRSEDGSIVWLEGKGKAFLDEHGEPVRMSGICMDITARKELEQEILEINQRLEERVAERTAEIRRSESRFRAVFENRAMGVAIVDPGAGLEILQVNRTLARMLGYNPLELVGKPLSGFTDSIEKTDADTAQILELMNKSKRSFRVERKMEDKAGNPVWTNAYFSLLEEPDSSESFVIAIVEDITEQMEAEQALAESEEMFRTLVDAVQDYALILLDKQGNVISWNAGAEKINGYRNEEILGRHISYFYTPEDVLDGKHETALTTAARLGSWEDEGWRIGKNRRFFAHVNLTPLYDEDGDVRGYAKITRDITERRNLEELIANATLEEQRRIAGALHDGIGQQLTGVRFIAMGLAKKLVGADSDTMELAHKLSENVAEALREVRELSRGIQPVEVDSNGLLNALKKLAEETEKIYEIRSSFQSEGEVTFEDNNTATQLYYIAREAVNNEMKHGAPSQVDVRLVGKNKKIELTIQSDGKGFDPESVGEGGMGLRTMKYRANLIGARYRIDSAPGEGTTIRCSLGMRNDRPKSE